VLPSRISLAIASSSAWPPDGDGWLHEIKHDGHRLVAILDGHGGLKLISRGGHDRTPLFGSPFFDLLPFDREIVLDGEIAVPDDRGVTHISDLQDAIAGRRPERLAYFAFDLLHLDGHDLRRWLVLSGSCYKAGPSWDWRKTKCHATGRFFVTGFQELGPGRLEVLHVEV
jgi:bifunctional non-homologous end joining protein LigD